jgi:hypothetical protein
MLIGVFPPVQASVTRRRVLLSAVGGPLLLSIGACTDDPPAQPPADPDREALQAARDVEAGALAAMVGWDTAADESSVTPTDARATVGAHVSALDKALTATPTPTPTGSGDAYELLPSPDSWQVVVALRSAAKHHTRALRTASPEISPLLASIAASDAALAAAIWRSS